MRWTTQIWTIESGQVASIASGNPVSPSQQTMSTSRTPRLASSAQTPAQNFAPLGGLDPDAQDMLDPVHVDADGDVRGLVAHMPAIADLHDQRVEVDHRVERLERPLLPGQDLVADLLDDVRDRLVRQVRADRRSQVVLDIADRHPAGVERDDHLVQLRQPPAASRDQPWRERPVPIPRDPQLDIADAGAD